LLFHHVGPATPSVRTSLTVSPARFSRFVASLAARGYRGLSASDWWDRQTGGRDAEKAVVLTFDDAYADVVEHALPSLVRFGFTATVFVVAGLVGGTNRWDDGPEGAGGAPLMSADDLRAWRQAGMEVGAHGMTHADLVKLDPVNLRAEVAGAREVLSGVVGADVRSFAYPYGSHDQATRTVVGAHYALAFGVEEGLNAAGQDALALRRSMVQPADSIADIRLRARLGWSPLNRMKTFLPPHIRPRPRRESSGR